MSGAADGAHSQSRIWLYAGGYFACYAPYAALTKLLSEGLLGTGGRIDGFAVLPLSALASLVAMVAFISAKRWWRHASQAALGTIRFPRPGIPTLLSGLATATIIATTTLSYTFAGVSIVFMMLLMRGGVLILAPVVDAIANRKVAATSWVALALSVAALVAAVGLRLDGRLSLLAACDVAAYLLSYFLRLRFMSRLAKNADETATIRYFVEEQMVATPAVVVALALYAWLGAGAVAASLRWGFTGAWHTGAWLPILCVGLLSQGTGVFGALVLLDNRTNVFCVAVNRASSVLAGTLATAVLGISGLGAALAGRELLGAGLLVVALLVLAWPSVAPVLNVPERAPPR